MRFVTDALHQMEHGRAAVEHDGIVFLSIEVDDLFALGDGRQRLAGEAQLFERRCRGVQLAEAAVDEDEAGHRLVLFRDALIAARESVRIERAHVRNADYTAIWLVPHSL